MATSEPLTEEDHAEVIQCARYGELEDLQTLLELGANANYTDESGSTALHKASANGSLEIVRLLHKHGAKYTANTSGNTPLHWACLNGHKEMVELLLELYPAEADVYVKNSFGRSAFTEALAAGHEEIGRIMLAAPSADPALQSSGASGSGSAAGEGVTEEEDEDDEDEDGELLAAGAEGEASGADGSAGSS